MGREAIDEVRPEAEGEVVQARGKEEEEVVGVVHPEEARPAPPLIAISDQPGDLARAVRFSGGRAVRLLVPRGGPVGAEAWWPWVGAALVVETPSGGVLWDGERGRGPRSWSEASGEGTEIAALFHAPMI